MSLREHLRDILPEILPATPKDAIKGTELIRLVRFRLKQDYSDATLRYHFSIMSCDPSAPIAKVAQGQGYYLRPDSRHGVSSSHHLIAFRQQTLPDLLGMSPVEISRDLLHAGRFRAIVRRHLEGANRFPFFFEDAFATGSPPENIWRFPDAAVVDWPAGQAGDGGGYRLDPVVFQRHRTLNAPLFHLTALKLRLRVDHDSLREEFFQCLSHGEWAHANEFFLALPVEDASLVDELAELGQRHGVGVLSFGFEADALDDLPDPEGILTMQPEEFDALMARARPTRLAAAEMRGQPSRPHPAPAGRESPDMARLFSWIESCIESGHPVPPSARA